MRNSDNGTLPILVRERVVAAIERAASGFPVVVFSAPAGFGKSIALAHFLARRGTPHVAFRADARHETTVRFARGLLAALAPAGLATVRPGAGDDELLAAAIGVVVGTERAVVLDGFAFPTFEPGVVAFVECLIEATRDRVSWILATRHPATLPVSRWCATETIDHPIDETELRFDAEETRALAAAAGVPFGLPDAARLTATTAGWPAAIATGIYAARSAQNPQAAFAAALAAMRGLLAKFVFANFSNEERRFLLRTCLFEELTQDTLAALGPDARTVLGRIRAETSLVGHGTDGGFAYHPAMKAMLEEALLIRGASSYEEVRASTADTLAVAGRYAEGARLAVGGNSEERILETLRSSGQNLIDRGETGIVREALDALPPATRETDPDAIALAAQAGGYGDAVTFERWCAAAALRAPSATVRAKLSLGLATCLARVARAADGARLLEAIDPDAVDDDTVRARLHADAAGLAARGGATDEHIARIAVALELAESIDDGVLRAAVYRRAADVFASARRFEEASRYASASVDAAIRANAPRIELRARAAAYRIAQELGRLESARATLRTIYDRASERGDLEMLLFGLCAASDVAAMSGDAVWLDELDAALAAADGAGCETYVEELGAALGDALRRSRALRRAWTGRFDEALALLDGGGAVVSAAEAAEAALYAAAAGCRERSADAGERARLAFAEEPNGGSPNALAARMFAALAAVLLDDFTAFEAAATALESRADRIPLPYIRFLRAVRTAGDYARNRMSRRRLSLATDAMREHDLGGYAALIDALPIRLTVVIPGTGLTATELSVLQLLCDGLTSREIAGRLGRSVLTIDSHAKSIVKKLRCTGGRREAVELARSGRISGVPARFSFLAG